MSANMVTQLAIVVATLAVAAAVLIRARHRRLDLGDVLAGRIAARPVPLADIYAGLDAHFAAAAALLQPDHDVLPVDDFWREVALDYLERMWALPAAERAS